MTIRLLFLHGLESGPPTRPARSSPELPTAAARAFLASNADVVVGSSFGGGVAARLAAAGECTGALVLLAPAGEKLFGVTRLPERAGRPGVQAPDRAPRRGDNNNCHRREAGPWGLNTLSR